MIQLNCGCEVQDYSDTVAVCLKEYDNDFPSIGYYTVCKGCYDSVYRGREDLIVSDSEAEDWLNSGEEGVQ